MWVKYSDEFKRDTARIALTNLLSISTFKLAQRLQ